LHRPLGSGKVVEAERFLELIQNDGRVPSGTVLCHQVID
jgi:hypothetical protein